MNLQFILNEHGVPVPEPHLETWGRWMAENPEKRVVAKDTIMGPKFSVQVSTIFLGLNIDAFSDKPPLVWESMAFWPDHHEMHRCTGNREQAEAMHVNTLKATCLQLRAMDKASKND